MRGRTYAGGAPLSLPRVASNTTVRLTLSKGEIRPHFSSAQTCNCSTSPHVNSQLYQQRGPTHPCLSFSDWTVFFPHTHPSTLFSWSSTSSSKFFCLTALIYAYIPQNLFINVTFSLSDIPSPTIPLPRRVQFGGYILFNDVSYSLRHVIMSSKCTEELEEKMCWWMTR